MKSSNFNQFFWGIIKAFPTKVHWIIIPADSLKGYLWVELYKEVK